MAPPKSAATVAIAIVVKAGVAHSIHAYSHDPALTRYGAEAAAALSIDPACIFKTLLVDVDGTAVCAVVPVSRTLSLKALAHAHGGKRAVMMDPTRAQRLTGYVLGGISPLGQRTPSPTYIDSSAESHERIFVSAGRRGLQIAMAPADLLSLTSGLLAHLTGSSEPAAMP